MLDQPHIGEEVAPIGVQVSELPVDDQAILLPPLANVIAPISASSSTASAIPASCCRCAGVKRLKPLEHRPRDPRQLVGQSHDRCIVVHLFSSFRSQ
jgi:hypothetical protein